MRLNEDYFDSIHADDFDNENDITVEKTESFPMDVLQWYKENKRYNAMFVVSKNFYSEIFKDVEASVRYIRKKIERVVDMFQPDHSEIQSVTIFKHNADEWAHFGVIQEKPVNTRKDVKDAGPGPGIIQWHGPKQIYFKVCLNIPDNIEEYLRLTAALYAALNSPEDNRPINTTQHAVELYIRDSYGKFRARKTRDNSNKNIVTDHPYIVMRYGGGRGGATMWEVKAKIEGNIKNLGLFQTRNAWEGQQNIIKGVLNFMNRYWTDESKK